MKAVAVLATLSAVALAGILAFQPDTPSLEETPLYRVLKERRMKNIERLQAYAQLGPHPRNIDFQGQRVSYFVDDRGVACAVGHLMRLSGHGDVVEQVRRTMNHVRIADVNDGPVFDWILASGFTKEECALIQPSYDWIDDPGKKPDPIFELLLPVPDPVVQKHLFNVVEQLRRDTENSLRISVERLLAR